ncbi:helix-turn-helix domain-containing protein [Sporosarcina sp. Marseille-Q4063]|uniref:helix-turn-helix domain-containing protein n=1 Tax=Sporosarcina sp. Marseille-Q4063 TaxID=2810514 RepID=UPI001BB00724|nr:RodZ domain-containing protein [Sporosarcina sp. Marseille-Q4063]QUW21904.1 helix-turn-helix domain-containing protein [Sporosarcina sp. Marseille-Q4063]
MTGLGDRLREARKAKGYSLDDLQSITKIQKRYLSGIENEEFGSMPGSFYVRAFIKQYAEAVGLDADEMLLLYRDSSGKLELKEEEQQHAPQTLSRRSGSRNNRLNEVLPKIIVALFIIVIIVAVWFLNKYHVANKNDEVGTEDSIIVDNEQPADTNKDDGTNGDAAGDDTDVEEDAEETEEPAVEQVLTHERSAGEDSFYRLSNAEGLKLEIRTNGDSWIGVLDRSNTERMPKPRGADTFKAGESVEIDASDTDWVRIRVGRTASTEIYVNGELLEYPDNRTTQNIIIEYEKE